MATVERECRQVHTIVTHARPHLDEVAAICVLRKYGGQLFPGIEKAKIVVFDPGKIHDVMKKTEEEWSDDGFLFVGVGGRNWMFVDHSHEDHPEECVFTMALKCLGLDKELAWRQVGEEVLREDRNGASSLLHIAPLVKAAYGYMDFEEAVVEIPRMVNFFLLGAYRKKQEAFQAALAEQERADVCQVIDVENEHTGLTHKLLVVRSNNSETAVAARHHGATLVVHVRDAELPMQQVYISCDKKQGLRRIDWLVSRIRRREHQLQCSALGVDFGEMGQEALESDGELLGWCYQRNAGALFNRTLTADYAARTKLTIEEITDWAKQFLKSTRSIRPRRQK